MISFYDVPRTSTLRRPQYSAENIFFGFILNSSSSKTARRKCPILLVVGPLILHALHTTHFSSPTLGPASGPLTHSALDTDGDVVLPFIIITNICPDIRITSHFTSERGLCLRQSNYSFKLSSGSSERSHCGEALSRRYALGRIQTPLNEHVKEHFGLVDEVPEATQSHEYVSMTPHGHGLGYCPGSILNSESCQIFGGDSVLSECLTCLDIHLRSFVFAGHHYNTYSICQGSTLAWDSSTTISE